MPALPEPTRYEAVAAALAEEGVRDVFGVMGVGNLQVLQDLVTRHSARYHAARIEGGAVAMADAYARVTGGIGVCAVTQGPGLTNTVTALTAATRYGSPVIVVTGDMPASTPKGSSQQIEHEAVIAPTGAAFRTLTADEDWYGAVRTEVQAARRANRPHVLNLPNDLQPKPNVGSAPTAAAIDSARFGSAGSASVADAAAAGPVVDANAIRAAAEVIAAARLPLVLAGRGAIGAEKELAHLAERAGAVLGTTLLGKDLFGDDPWTLGIIGGFASVRARAVLEQVDCIVSFGAGLNRWTTKEGALLSGRRHVHCDIDAVALARPRPEVALHGDAADIAAALLGAISGGGAARRETVATLLAAPPEDDVPRPGATGLHPRTVLRRIDGLVPRQRVLVSDGGHFVGFPAAEMAVPHPRDFVFTQNFGTIGLGLGAAVGAAVGRPDRLCVLVAGDGGFAMSIADLETAIRLNLSLLVVVLDDGGYGAEFHHMASVGMPTGLARFRNPDFGAVAVALGGRGARVRTDAELEAALDGFGPGQGVLVLDVVVDDGIVDRWMSDRFSEAYRASLAGQGRI